MAFDLTEGAITTLSSGGKVDKPVLQILATKKLPGGASDRYRLLVSDGIHSHSFAMLATQLNDLVHRGELDSFAVVRIDKYICNQVQQDKRVLIILDATVLHRAEEVGGRIGNPVPIASGNSAPNRPSDPEPTRQSEPSFAENNFASSSREMNNFGQPSPKVIKKEPNSFNGMNQSFSPNMSGSQRVFPISSLTPYQNRWKICARVSSKSNIRTWNNSRGTGKLFSFDLIDSSGEIKATAFNEQCDKFFDLIEVNKIYYISNCQLKTANKNFSSIKNDYEMSLRNDSIIELCNDSSSEIPTMKFSFTSIDNIVNVPKDSVIDVIGVCKSAGDVQTITVRSTNREVAKRDIIIVDQSNNDINLTIWGAEAENFNGSSNPVVAVKGARVSDFSGRSLSTVASSSIYLNPDIKEACFLRGWYDHEGKNKESTPISVKGSQGGGGFGGNWKVLQQIFSDSLGMGDKPDFITCLATVIMVRKENCMYMACPTQACNKKVVDLHDGQYRCEKCNQSFDTFKWRLLLSMNIADYSGNHWVTCFQEAAEAVLGSSAEELGRLRETDENQFHEAIFAANFKTYNFKLRAKMETFNDETRVKTTVISATPVEYKDAISRLLSQFK